MSKRDLTALTEYAKAFSALTPDKEAVLRELGLAVAPRLGEVTDHFYTKLQTIPQARPVLEGRIDDLKRTHVHWLRSLFDGPYDDSFTAAMYRVGDVHVRVKLPVEFMAGGIVLITEQLIELVGEIYRDNIDRYKQAMSALNSILGFCLFIMQESYQSSSLAEELEKFLKITGMSRKLFDNLANAYR